MFVIIFNNNIRHCIYNYVLIHVFQRKQLNNSHRWTLILAQSPVEFWQVFCQFLDLFKKGNISGQTKPGKITRRSMAFLDPGSKIIDLNKLTGALTDAVNLKSSLDTLEKTCLELLGKR